MRVDRAYNPVPPGETPSEEFLRVTAQTSDLMWRTATKMEELAQSLGVLCGAESPAVIILLESAGRLARQSQALDLAVSHKCEADLRAAQEASGNMLRAALAGVIHANPGHEAAAPREGE